ncbi:MAG: DUF1670 domain-containing protein [Deinococcota bacterium]
MSSHYYVGTSQRNFQQALIHLLGSQYGLLGSHKVLELLAQDVQQLVEQFYPPGETLTTGWMIFTGTRACGPKAHPGQRAGEHELVTLAWPVLLPEDTHYLATHPDTQAARQAWFQQRLVRLIEYGAGHPQGPVLLTNDDLGALLGLTQGQVSRLLQQARQESGKELLTKGYYFDQGVRPTHKAEIIELYEAGKYEDEIARLSEHDQESVGHYIRDYERVKLLMSYGAPVGQIPVLIGMQPSVVEAYAKMVAKYHPELLRHPEPSGGPLQAEKGVK